MTPEDFLRWLLAALFAAILLTAGALVFALAAEYGAGMIWIVATFAALTFGIKEWLLP